MNDAGGVGRIQRVGQLREDAGDLPNRHLTVRDARGQGFARVVGHGDERLAGMVADLVHRRDVGMIERAGGARLAQQAGRGFRIMDRSRRKKFERDPPFEFRIFGQIHRAHAAGADVADDPVVRDVGAYHGEADPPGLQLTVQTLGDRIGALWRGGRTEGRTHSDVVAAAHYAVPSGGSIDDSQLSTNDVRRLRA